MSTKTLIDAEALPAIVGSRRSELVRGEIINLSPVSRHHSRTVIELSAKLNDHVKKHRLGEVHTGYGFILSRDPDTVRAPDVAFVSTARLAAAPDTGFFDGAPDLAVEVLSPDDRASEVQRKVREYLRAGATAVWVVDPEERSLTEHFPAGDARTHIAPAILNAGTVLVGFSLDLDAIFAAR